MINKLCPSCLKPLPLMSGNNITCKHCNSKLTARHGGIIFSVLVMLLYIPYKLSLVAVMMSDTILQTVLIFTGAVLVLAILRHLVTNYEVDSNSGA